MITVCILGKNIRKTVETLLENDLSDIEQIIINTDFPVETDIPVDVINTETENKSKIRNEMIKISKGEYILWLSENAELEDSTIEELVEVVEDLPDADVVYPNEILIIGKEEDVKTFTDWYGNEKSLIQSLTIENYLPEWGVLTKKDIFLKLGMFDESFEDYEFYDFVYKNLKNLRLKNSDLSFVTNRITESFIDTSYRSKTLRDILGIYDWKKEIFPSLSWDKDEKLAFGTAYTIIGDKLYNYYDLYNASDYYRKSLLSYHNQISLKKLINTLVQMGLFDKALELTTEEQGLSQKEVEEVSQRIKQFRELVLKLEKAVEEGKAGDILVSINDIVSIYRGAPIYNILGVIYAIKGELENSYRFFYKAVTMNPLDEDILKNLIDVAEKLGKKDKVKGLINRLLG